MPHRTDNGLSFGRRLRDVRRKAHLSQAELGDFVGVTKRVISYYESESKYPPAKLLARIAEVLNVSTDELLGVTLPDRPDGRTIDGRLLQKFYRVQRLPLAKRRALNEVIDAFLANEGRVADA